MNTYLACTIMLLFSLQSVGQKTGTPASLTKTELLMKSKKQKTTGWYLLAGGSVSMAIGLLIPRGEYHSSGNFVEDLFGGGHYENDGIRSSFVGLGFCAITGSIPCFLAAGRNRKRAASLSLENQGVPEISPAGWVIRRVPSLQLTVKF